jgi:hypothetical protein
MNMVTHQDIIDNIRTRDTETIKTCIQIIGGGDVPMEQWIVRVDLLRVYEERMGGEAVDALMDEIGL